MKNVYFKEFTYGQKGDYIFWIATLAPLLLWIFLIFKYYFKKNMYKSVHPYTNIFLLMPFAGAFYNIFTSVYHSKRPDLPVDWDFCLSTNIPSEAKKNGAVGFYDYSCHSRQYGLAYRYIETYISRMYYVNYVLLFLVIIIQTNFSLLLGKIKKKHSILLNLLCISALLGIIGSICTLFTETPIFTYIALRFFSTILWMSCSILTVFLINLYSYIQ